MRLQGRVAATTGGALGIGAATARLFAAEARRVARIPMGRFGEADEVARAALFLASGRRQLRHRAHAGYGRRLPGGEPLVAPAARLTMIRRFSTLYVGHIELEQCGLSGIPADSRRYPNLRLTEVFDTATALARATDALGYDTLWLAEHHFQHEGYECIPNVPLLAVDLAHRTSRVKIGCAFNIVPIWHPLRLAEDYATADILTGGRVVFGVGRGYHSREVETFGNPMLDGEANRTLFEEQVEIVRKAFREESFSHQGKHYTLPPEVPYRGYRLKEITLVPRPLRRPVEVWQPIVSGSARSLDFMALKELEPRYPGLEHVMIAWALGTPRALMLEQLTRFAREVMPAFG
jgi:hypothetical protein